MTRFARRSIASSKKRARPWSSSAGSTSGKVGLLAAVSDDVIKKGVKAGDLIKQIAPMVGGGGGGRPNMAQAGGKEPSKLGDALAHAKHLLESQLTK